MHGQGLSLLELDRKYDLRGKDVVGVINFPIHVMECRYDRLHKGTEGLQLSVDESFYLFRFACYELKGDHLLPHKGCDMCHRRFNNRP